MMAHWAISDFATLAGGLVFGRDASMPHRIVSDSRDVLPGDAFIALSGTQQDGHAFLGDAVTRGANILIGSNESALRKFEDEHTCVLVNDTENTTINVARLFINKINPIVIAVTGSVGKTTTRECIYNVLSKKYKVHRPFRSYNTSIGCALTILSMPIDTNILVLEMGANHENEIASMVSMFPPDVAVITEIAASHLEGFKTIEGVLSAKCEIYQNKKTKIIFYNSDRIELQNVLKNNINKLAYGVGLMNSFYAIKAPNFVFSNDQPILSFKLSTKKNEYYVTANFVGVHNVYAISFALALGEFYNIEKTKMLDAILHMHPLDGRGLCILLKCGVKLIDDTYNANPLSMKAALSALKNINTSGLRIAVLGEMKELGFDSVLYHRYVLKETMFCDVVMLYGDIWKEALMDIERTSIPKCVKICQDLNDCFFELANHIKNKNIILVKGSHSNNLNVIVSKLKEEFSI